MIDELELFIFINKCKHLKHKFLGIYAADNYPLNLKENTFIIVNSDKSNQLGTHWLLLCNRDNKYLFGDPLGLPITYYPHICDRLSFADFELVEIIKSPLQKLDSNLCGLFCIYIAHYVFSAYFPLIPYISETELSRFVKHLT